MKLEWRYFDRWDFTENFEGRYRKLDFLTYHWGIFEDVEWYILTDAILVRGKGHEPYCDLVHAFEDLLEMYKINFTRVISDGTTEIKDFSSTNINYTVIYYKSDNKMHNFLPIPVFKNQDDWTYASFETKR